MQVKNGGRERVFDYFKLYSILLVISSHFLVNYVKYESIPLRIANGKYGVQIFAVILGILAYRSGRKRKEDVLHYALRRYAYFVICELVINSIYYFLNINGCHENMSFGFVIGESLILGDDIFLTVWFFRDFLAGSIISFIAGRYGMKRRDLIALVISLGIMDKVHVSACVMGCLAQTIFDDDVKLFRKWWVTAGMILISFCVKIILSKSSLTYFIFGITSMLTVIAVKENGILSRIPDKFFVGRLGEMTMSMMLIHPCLIDVVNRLSFTDGRVTIICRYLLLLVLTTAASLLLDIVIRYLSKLANILIDILLKKMNRFAFHKA